MFAFTSVIQNGSNIVRKHLKGRPVFHDARQCASCIKPRPNALNFSLDLELNIPRMYHLMNTSFMEVLESIKTRRNVFREDETQFSTD